MRKGTDHKPRDRPAARQRATPARPLSRRCRVALGVVVGIYVETFDHHTFVNNVVILPLTFLGGVFYSVSVLPSPWHELSHANPLFYIVDAIRYGFLGTSDVAPALAIAVTAALAAAMFWWSVWLFRSGHKLKP